jgi:hypothetical protein
MFGRMRRRVGLVGRVEFCDPCGEVSTPTSRAQALRDRTRTEAMYLTGFRR